MFRIHRKQQKCANKSSLNICVVKITQGGAVAAPVGGQILSDVLPYLELTKDNQKEEDILQDVEVPEIRNLNLKEAKNKLKELGLEISLSVELQEGAKQEEIIIKEQLPKPGIKVKQGSKISVEI